MLVEEAKWFGEKLSKISEKKLSICLNLGSGNTNFRIKRQPWIYKYIFEPMSKRGVKVIHSDINSGEGIDLVLDIEKDNFRKMKNITSVLINNLLEHVDNPGVFAKKILGILPKGGLLFVSVPYKYPFHPSPIDTMYRPKPRELALLFPNTKIVAKRLVRSGTFIDYIFQNKLIVVLYFFRMLVTFYDFKGWISAVKHLGYFNKNFVATCIVLRKN